MRKIFFLLGSLTDADIEWLIANGIKERVSPGTILIREGGEINALYFVLDGSLGVSSGSANNNQIAKLGSGEVVGEMSFIDTGPPSATVTALDNAIVLGIPRQAILTRLDANCEFAARFYRALAVLLSHRLRETVRKLADGAGKRGKDDAAEDADELDPGLLSTVHLAASRFNRVLQRLLAE